MTQPILRVLIQEKLANGRLSHTHIPRIWGGPRNGETCDGCEETVTKVQRTLQSTPTRRTHPTRRRHPTGRTHLAMPKGLLRGLTLAAFAALGTMTCAASAGAATLITSCATLDTFGATYVLTADLTPDCATCLGLTGNPTPDCGTCLVVANDRITIDLAGHTISGSCGGGAGVTDDGTSRQGTTIKNGTITGFDVGVFLGSSTRNLIRNLKSSTNSAAGIIVGERSLVKGCVIEDNGGYGIIIGEFGQVQDCTITGHVAPEGNVGFGIFGAGHLLVTDNDVVDNVAGIVVGDFSTVSFNTSSSNVAVGLLAGNHSLVTGNTAQGNGNAGIATGGLSTVSYNTSNGNEGGGIAVGVESLFDGTQSLVTGNTTNDNGDVGVEAWCPSTVTNNKSSGNRLNYNINNINGLGCHTKNNN